MSAPARPIGRIGCYPARDPVRSLESNCVLQERPTEWGTT
jgi:hypothetical protein